MRAEEKWKNAQKAQQQRLAEMTALAMEEQSLVPCKRGCGYARQGARGGQAYCCGTCRDQPHTPHDAFMMGPNHNKKKKQTSWGPGGPGPTGTFHGPMCKRRELPNVETEMKRQEERGQMQLNVDELEKELGVSQRQVREAEVEKEEATRLSERKGGRRGERAGGGDAGADEED
jgi:hypothetical protein